MTTWRYMTAKMAERPVLDAFVGEKSHRRSFQVVTPCSCGSPRITRYRKGVLRSLIQQVCLSLNGPEVLHERLFLATDNRPCSQSVVVV